MNLKLKKIRLIVPLFLVFAVVWLIYWSSNVPAANDTTSAGGGGGGSLSSSFNQNRKVKVKIGQFGQSEVNYDFPRTKSKQRPPDGALSDTTTLNYDAEELVKLVAPPLAKPGKIDSVIQKNNNNNNNNNNENSNNNNKFNNIEEPEESDNSLDYVEYHASNKYRKKIDTPERVTFLRSDFGKFTTPTGQNEEATFRREPYFKDAIAIPRKQSNVLLNQLRSASQVPSSSNRKRPLNDHLNGNVEKGGTWSGSDEGPYVLIHNAAASVVGVTHDNPNPFPTYIPRDQYVFTSKSFPKKLHLRPNLANGFLGTVVHSKQVHVNSVYNGKHVEIHRAGIPSTASFNVSSTFPVVNFSRSHQLDVSTGVYSETSSSNLHSFTQRIYAHRTLVNLLVTEVDYERKSKVVEPVVLKIQLNKWQDNQDFTFKIRQPKYQEVSYKVGILNAPESDDLSNLEVHVMYDHVPSELKPPKDFLRCKWVFVTVYAFSLDEVERHYEEARRLLVARDDLYTEHLKGWSELWAKGRIDLEGDVDLSRSIYASFYYILSNIPLRFNDSRFVGLSPSGLPFGNADYYKGGRIKADQELYIFPPMLAMHQELSKMILFSRNSTVSGAYANARNMSVHGLVFPYEGASVGIEISKDTRKCFKAPYVTASVLHAIRQYVYATNDTYVNATLWPIVRDGADFLHARLSVDGDRFRVLDQLPIDETLDLVSDSLSGNALIRDALSLPYDLTKMRGQYQAWKMDAENIVFPQINSSLHAPYSGYAAESAVSIGEADVLMYNFPLMTNISRERFIANDLQYYARILDHKSSPMSKALLSINWLELGKKIQGDSMLKTLMSHHTRPFQTWTTISRSNKLNPNHLSGMGSLLQSVVFGYGGFRFLENMLVIHPTLPRDSDVLHFVGVDYLGRSLNVVVKKAEISVMVTASPRQAEDRPVQLYLVEFKNKNAQKLDLDVQVSVTSGKCAVVQQGFVDRV